jgi:hypothetical protein
MARKALDSLACRNGKRSSPFVNPDLGVPIARIREARERTYDLGPRLVPIGCDESGERVSSVAAEKWDDVRLRGRYHGSLVVGWAISSKSWRKNDGR